MKSVVTKVSLDITKQNSQVVIPMFYGDTHRELQFSLTENGKPYKLDNCTIAFTGKKADGTFLNNACEVDYKKQVAVYKLNENADTRQTTTCKGQVECQLVVNEQKVINGETILENVASPYFKICVLSKVYNDEDIIDSVTALGYFEKLYVPLARTIAGKTLNQNLTAAELHTALNTYPILRLSEDPTVSFAIKGEVSQFGYLTQYDGENSYAKLYLCKQVSGEKYTWQEIGETYIVDGSVTIEKFEGKLKKDITDVLDGAFPPSKNLLRLPDYSISAENNNGISIEIKNGLFSVVGTASEAVALNIPIEAFTLTAGDYFYSARNVRNLKTRSATVFIKKNKYEKVDSVSASLNTDYNRTVVSLEEDTTISYISIAVSKGAEVDQTFNLQLEAGTEPTIYEPANKIFGGQTTLTVEKLKDNVVLASSFGATGDGVIDDTEALKKAIKFCSENYKILKLDSGKNYLISETLYWDETSKSIYIDGNFATIFAKKNITDLIKINCKNINDNFTLDNYELITQREQVIKNLILDCRGVVNTGLRIEKGIKVRCTDLVINNPVSNGIYVNLGGYENFISNIHINRYLDTLGGVGIYGYGSDNTFDNIAIIGCQIGVVNVGGDNHYSRVHPWSTTKALENLKQSISFDCRNGYCTFSQCMGDSTNIIFRLSNKARARISNCANTWTNDFATHREKGTNPYLFYFVKEQITNYILPHENKGKDVTVSACEFKPTILDETHAEYGTFKCYYSNLTEDDTPMLIDRAVTGWEETSQPNTIETQIGNVDKALEELHTYAQSIISGGVTE